MNSKKVARPLNPKDANEQIDMFLGMPQKDKEGNLKGYKRIDTTDKIQLKILAERKLASHLNRNVKFNTFKTFIQDEIRSANQKIKWFNPITERKNTTPLKQYIEFLEVDFEDTSENAFKNKYKESLDKMNFNKFLIEQQKKNYQPQLDKILEIEETILNPIEKIEFLKIEKQKYLSDLTSDAFVISGTIGFPDMELFMDREISNRIKEIELSKVVKLKKYLHTIWFQVGLLFANGEMDKLIIKHTIDKVPNPNGIARELGHPNYSKYILATLNNYSGANGDKNIYNNPDKIRTIYEHCQENKIEMTERFKSLI